MARRGFLLLFFALALAAASAASAFLLSIAASRQPTPTPTAGPTPTPEPRNGAKSLQQQQQQQPLPTTTTTTTKSSLGSSSSCRAAAAAAATAMTKTTTTSPPPPLVPLLASAPAWQRGARPRLKVLAVPLVSGRSHLFVMHAVAAELAARGHEVKMLVVEDDVPAVPQTAFSSFNKNTTSSSSSASSSGLEILPYSSLRDFAWWRDYQERQASASPLRDDHAAAWVVAADALLSDSKMMSSLREWGPDVVVGDTAYLATYGLAAALGKDEEEVEEEEEEGKRTEEKPRLSSPSSQSPSSSPSLSPPPPSPPRRSGGRRGGRGTGLPFATVSCTGIVDPVHGWLMRFENDAGSIPQFGSGLRAPMTLPDQLRNRAFKFLASLYFRAAFLRLWRPVMLKHEIPLPGSQESVPRELGHIFNASPLLEWPRSLPPHVKLVGPILMDFFSKGEKEENGEKEGEVVAAVASATSAAAATSSSSSSSSSPSSPSTSAPLLNGRKDERAPLPPRVAALADAAAAGLSPPLVFVSFGTTVRLSAADARAVAAALRSLAPRKVVWKLAAGDLGGGLTPESLLAEMRGGGERGGGEEEEEENIVVVPWLPQQSLLSKRRLFSPPPSSLSSSSLPPPPPSVVAAFVTHGGMNGLYEAVAAGVPLVGVPFFGDGEDNLEKAAGRGVGVTLGRGGLRKGERNGESERRRQHWWWWWSSSKKNATATAAFPSSSLFSSSNLNTSDPSTGAGRLALALRRVLDNPDYAAEAERMARGLRARAASTGRLPREEAADAVELGAWAWRHEREEAEKASSSSSSSASASSSSPSTAFLEKGKDEEEACAAAATE